MSLLSQKVKRQTTQVEDTRKYVKELTEAIAKDEPQLPFNEPNGSKAKR